MSDTGADGSSWFPPHWNSWSLDVVSLLAVMGESSVAAQSQAITASPFGMLPRILPAPQALLKPSRPLRLPEARVFVTGVYGGTTIDSIGFFGNLVTPIYGLPPYSFAVVSVQHTKPPKRNHHHHQQQWLARIRAMFSRRGRETKSGDAQSSCTSRNHRAQDEESNSSELAQRGGSTTQTARASNQDCPSEPPRLRITLSISYDQPATATSPEGTGNASYRPFWPMTTSLSPIDVLSLLSCALSLTMIVAAVYWHDGIAIFAITMISLAATVGGFASRWRPKLMKRTFSNKVPRGDTLLRTREGAIILVRCTEELARELYFGTEECVYVVGERLYRLLMIVATALLMVSVALLGNCTWNSKVLIGVSYVVLNGLYWALGMLPQSAFWDLSNFAWQDVTPEDSSTADQPTTAHADTENQPSFTRTLWYAIRETGRVDWIERSNAAPNTKQWKQWVAEASDAAQRGNRSWPAVQRMREIMAGEVLEHSANEGIVR